MTITPADVLLWTNVTVSQTQLDAFGPAAEAKLNADGGSAISGAPRTQLLSYLVAGYATTALGGSGKQSETIGNYSYTRQSAKTTSVWTDLYKEKLSALIASAGQVIVTGSPLVEHIDKDIFKLNRTFPKSSGRLI